MRFPKSLAQVHWQAPDHCSTVETIDMHTEGEPLRIYLFPQLAGDTILARRRDALARFDDIRTALMWEPRGHADMYGCILTEPVSPEAHLGVIFLHNEGYSTMCGHGIIAVTKLALETGIVPVIGETTEVVIDAPAGLITAFGHMRDGKVHSVSFLNVPSYVVDLDARVTVPGLGEIHYDLAFGGAYYAYVQAADVGLTCRPKDFRTAIELGVAIKRAVMSARKIRHPFEEDLGFLYGVIFIGQAENPAHHSRNVCVFAEGEVDRSPTGTGVSGRAAIHHARGELKAGESVIIESIIGSSFTVQVAETTTFGDHPAVIPRVEGRAYITGRHSFVIDPDDPLKNGFILR
ncbi:MAG: proline racemase family protein [Acidobacteriota bacterium]|nr:proline racemase family protein [Acidobacteriota bacterium]